MHVGGHGLADRGHQDHDSDERVTHLYSPLGASLRPVPYCVAGDMCAVAKLGSAETGDTISGRDRPLLLMCAAGSRSAAATAWLMRNGYSDVANVAGGINEWQKAGLPVRSGPIASSARGSRSA